MTTATAFAGDGLEDSKVARFSSADDGRDRGQYAYASDTLYLGGGVTRPANELDFYRINLLNRRGLHLEPPAKLSGDGSQAMMGEMGFQGKKVNWEEGNYEIKNLG